MSLANGPPTEMPQVFLERIMPVLSVYLIYEINTICRPADSVQALCCFSVTWIHMVRAAL